MNVVEQVSRVTLGRCGWVGGFGWWTRGEIFGVTGRGWVRGRGSGWLDGNASTGFFYGELGDGLGLAVVEDLEIVLLKVADGVSLGIAGYDSYYDELYVYFEGGGDVAGRHLGGVLIFISISIRLIIGLAWNWGGGR